MVKFKRFSVVVTTLLITYNTFAQETKSFETITDAINYTGNDKNDIVKLIITGQIKGNDYSIDSEWRKFFGLGENSDGKTLFPSIETVEILTSQDIPDAVKNQGFFFRGGGAYWLKGFSAPNVKYIGAMAFSYCEKLIKVDFPSVTSIGEYAFGGCEKLTTINIPLVKTIGDGAFWNCKNLTTVNYFPLVTTIGNRAFSDCENLTTVDLPLVTTIGFNAFFYCKKLTTINLPVIVTIEDGAFQLCENLTKIDFPVAVNIGNYTFGYCSNLTTVNLPIVTNIGKWGFQNCNSLTSIDLPLVKTIEDSAFYDCEKLTLINLPVVENVGRRAFSGCSSLTTVSLGTNFETETEIKFGNSSVFFNVETENVDLILGEFVLPKPDLDKNTWQTRNGTADGTPYTWKSIKVLDSIVTIKEIQSNSLWL